MVWPPAQLFESKAARPTGGYPSAAPTAAMSSTAAADAPPETMVPVSPEREEALVLAAESDSSASLPDRPRGPGPVTARSSRA